MALKGWYSWVKLGLNQSGRCWLWFGHGNVPFACLMQCGMVDISCGCHDDVLAHVIAVVVLLDHISWNCLHVVDVPEDGKSHLMVLVYSPVCDFDRGFQRLTFLGLQQFSMNCGSFVLHVLLSVQRISDHVPYNLHCFRQISVKNRHHVTCVLSRCVCVKVTSHVLHLQLQLVPWSIFGALEVQMLQEMCCTAWGLSLVTTAAFYEYWDAKLLIQVPRYLTGHAFACYHDAIWCCCYFFVMIKMYGMDESVTKRLENRQPRTFSCFLLTTDPFMLQLRTIFLGFCLASYLGVMKFL